MKEFNELTQKEREVILSKRITTQLLVDRITLNFEKIENDLPNVDMSNDFEVPPMIYDNKHFAQILTFASPDNKGRWIRTVARTYMEEGRVLYKKKDNESFIVTLKFD